MHLFTRMITLTLQGAQGRAGILQKNVWQKSYTITAKSILPNFLNLFIYLFFFIFFFYCMWNSSAQPPTLTLRTRRYAAHAPGRSCNNEETFNGGAQYCVNLMVMGLLKSRVVNCLLRIHSNTLRRFLSVPHNEFVRHFLSINRGDKLTFAEWWAFRSHDNRKYLDRLNDH